MATNKVTFTLDQATVHRISEASERLQLPKSQIVREAVAEYCDRIGRLSERERLHLLDMFDTLVPRIPLGSHRAVERELAAIRAARRSGGRRSLSRKKA